MRKRARKSNGRRPDGSDDENEENREEEDMVDDVQEDEEEEPVRKYHLTHIIRENATRPLVCAEVLRIGQEGTEENKNIQETQARSLVLTVGGDQANVYEGKYMDLASHFVHAPNEHVPLVGELKCGCWIASDPEKNDAMFALGATDGVISVISLAESRVVKRLGGETEADRGLVVRSMVGSPDSRYVIAALLMDPKTDKSFVDVWNVESGTLSLRINLPGSTAYDSINFVPGCAKQTIACSKGDDLVFFEGTTEKETRKLPSRASSVQFLASADDVLMLNTSGVACLYNFKTKEKNLPFPKSVKLTCIAKSRCNRFIASGDDRGGAYVVDLHTNDAFALRSHRTKSLTVTGVAFTANGLKDVVCTSNEGSLWRWTFRDTVAKPTSLAMEQQPVVAAVEM